MGGVSLLLLAGLGSGPTRLLLILMGGTVLLIAGAALASKHRTTKTGKLGAGSVAGSGDAVSGETGSGPPRLVAPLEVYLSARLARLCGLTDEDWRAKGEVMQQALRQQLGLEVPLPVFVAEPSLAEDRVQIFVREDLVHDFTLSPDEILVAMTSADLELHGLSGRSLSDPLTGAPLTAVSMEQKPVLIEAKLPVLFAWGYVLGTLQSTVLSHAAEFVSIQETQQMLDRLLAEQPRLVEEMVPGVIGRRELTETLRRLAREGLSIKDLQRILEAISETPGLVGHVPRLVEVVRRRLVPQLRGAVSSKLRAGWTAHFAGPNLSALLRRSLKDGLLHLSLAECREIFAALHAGLAPGQGWAERPVLVVDPALRPLVLSLLQPEFPTIVVLSSDELDLIGGVRSQRVVDLKPGAAAEPKRVIEMPARVA